MTYFVTGGTGFIGRFLIERLLEREGDIHVLVRKGSRKKLEALVKEGNSLQKKTQGAAEERFSEVTSKMTSMADEVTAKAGQHWDKLETIFEERTAKALKKLGVPTAKDVQALMDRVDALSAQVAGRAKAAAKTAAPKKRAPAKTAAKRAPRKSAA